MPGSVIVSTARTPIGKLSGALASFSAMDLGGDAIGAALERGGVGPGAGRLRDHGPRPAGRAGPDHRPPGRGEGRDPDERAGDHDQQGLPVGHQRAVPGGPDDPGGRRRSGRRRRHGVHDQRAVPAAQGPGRLPDGQRRADRLADPRRSLVRLRRGAHGRRHRAVHRQLRWPHPRAPGRVRGEEPRARRVGDEGGRFADEIVRGAGAAAQGRPGAGGRGRRRASRAPRASRSPGCAPRSPRTARSPPATPRRSPTAPRR